MTGHYDPVLVFLSFVIATLASYTALELAARVTAADGSARRWWLAGGGTVMGLGIWSMHLVGMLAFHLPVPIAYSLPLMLLSVAVAIAASLLALVVVSRPVLGPRELATAGVFMGMAIAGMHYIGMASMYMRARQSYEPRIVAISILIAIAASTAALWLAFRFRSQDARAPMLPKLVSSATMGIAIAGMHYTAMAAAHFSHGPAAQLYYGKVLATNHLAAAVVIGSFVIIAFGIVGGIVDRALHSRAGMNERLLRQAAELKEQANARSRAVEELETTNRQLHSALQAAEEARRETEKTAAALRASEERLQQAQKMEAIGNLAGGIAHDFNNLLTVIRCNAELITPDVAPRSKGDLDELIKSVDRAASLTQQLLAYGRRQFLQPVNISLNLIVDHIDIMMRRLVPENIEITVDLDPSLGPVHVDQGRMEQVITNLVVNATRAMPDGGRLVIRTRNVRSLRALSTHDEAGPREAVMLEVEDNGHGMTREVRERAFEPFFTTRPHGEGSGLGLSMVYGIVKQSAGEVVLDSEVGRGTIVRILLPRVAGVAESPQESVDETLGPMGWERILLVEDQDAVRVAARRILATHGYTIVEAENGAVALERYSEDSTFDLVITDLVMPEMGGRELVAKLREINPELPAIYMSGYSIDRVASDADADVPVIQKPFTTTSFAHAVQQVLQRASARRLEAIQ
ncbi:MAG TPA: MHYT domain-containing protein [Gemmatimonadaceae bacterium]